ncbi:alpha/beta fold hydrolase [Trichocoleus sp. FACHB-262]|uniref:thioesterase II family protein n=1 Tax=Trichocoleus sp. FACHB-262 TaxID=2692869 RepID=UPI0028C48991|nr:alpha/beta fold hydrolase [Trichocoleus sp. FACHB-262]
MPTATTYVTYPKRNSQARLRLFCFPYAGANSFIFRPWLHSLPADVELGAIELPGHGTRIAEPLFTRMTKLVEAIASSLLPHLDKPFAFFGHSMGAWVSFEVARWLQAHHVYPVHLFVSGARAPQLPSLRSPLHQLPEAEFVAALRRLQGTPEAVLDHTELMELMLPILRADFAVLETYTYSPQTLLPCPITAFGGLQDVDVSPEMLHAWQTQTNASFSHRMLPGNHFFIHSDQPLLLQLLTQELTQIVSHLPEYAPLKSPQDLGS